MKLIIEVDLEQVPNIADAMLLVSQSMMEWFKATGKQDLAALVTQKYNWMPQYNVGLIAEAVEAANPEHGRVQARIAVTDSKFDTSQWGKELISNNPGRYTAEYFTSR